MSRLTKNESFMIKICRHFAIALVLPFTLVGLSQDMFAQIDGGIPDFGQIDGGGAGAVDGALVETEMGSTRFLPMMRC